MTNLSHAVGALRVHLLEYVVQLALNLRNVKLALHCCTGRDLPVLDIHVPVDECCLLPYNSKGVI